MFERLDAASSTAVVQALEEARLLGAGKLEAEHVLLALSRPTTRDVGRVLAEAGLDHDGLRRALDAETERSLEAAGVTLTSVGLLERPLPATSQPRWGASAKRALEQALVIAKGHGDRRIHPAHILLGVLSAGEGTVPRALAGAGIDTAALIATAEAALPSQG